MVKNPPVMQETCIQSLGQEDPLEMEWLPTLVFLPGKFHGQRSLVGYSPWSHKELDTTERLIHFFTFINLKISRSILISQSFEVEYIAYYGL